MFHTVTGQNPGRPAAIGRFFDTSLKRRPISQETLVYAASVWKQPFSGFEDWALRKKLTIPKYGYFFLKN